MSQSTTTVLQTGVQEKVANRSMIVVAALIIQLCLGVLYAWLAAFIVSGIACPVAAASL